MMPVVSRGHQSWGMNREKVFWVETYRLAVSAAKHVRDTAHQRAPESTTRRVRSLLRLAPMVILRGARRLASRGKDVGRELAHELAAYTATAAVPAGRSVSRARQAANNRAQGIRVVRAAAVGSSLLPGEIAYQGIP